MGRGVSSVHLKMFILVLYTLFLDIVPVLLIISGQLCLYRPISSLLSFVNYEMWSTDS